MHFGAHTPNFHGDPDGLVLEPMNACLLPFPGKTEQSNADWTKFGDVITGTSVTAAGVPRNSTIAALLLIALSWLGLHSWFQHPASPPSKPVRKHVMVGHVAVVADPGFLRSRRTNR